MKPITQEWIEKDESDFAVAQLLLAQLQPKHDIVCFHAQQCVEKYLKACLQEANIFFPKTHELPTLLDLLLPIQPEWESLRRSVDSLTAYAVEFRYPGAHATSELSTNALKDCTDVRETIREYLQLSEIDSKRDGEEE